MSPIYRASPNVLAVMVPHNLLTLERLDLLQEEPNPISAPVWRQIKDSLSFVVGWILFELIESHQELLDIPILRLYECSWDRCCLQIMPTRKDRRGIPAKAFPKSLDVCGPSSPLDPPTFVTHKSKTFVNDFGFCKYNNILSDTFVVGLHAASETRRDDAIMDVL
jgi:hypothetical protein